MIHENSITRKVLEYIKANPGARRRDILEGLPEGVPKGSVSRATQHLSATGAIENRGKTGCGSRWHAIDISTEEQYRAIAQDLLNELKEIHHSQRVPLLAKRLQEIFGS